MKITIQEDGEDGRIVTVGANGNDQNIDAVMELIRSLLAGWGFAESTINDAIGKP